MKKIVALLPMKGTSEREPNKNLKLFNGKLLYHYVMNELLKSKYIEFVVKNYVPQLDSYRITLTYPTLLNCKESIVLIKGEEKERIFNEILKGEGENYPITKLLSSNINWIIGN
ncbi:6-phosphogluconolactonase [Polaribacter sp.]|uniref:6-phosphogluconolactonase n=1 Tax=Polaribacter sp. TaxID=1920175 RepID=UPI0025FC1FF7|nr:6-phosphogluconolactonase [Polaribacter sp.]